MYCSQGFLRSFQLASEFWGKMAKTNAKITELAKNYFGVSSLNFTTFLKKSDIYLTGYGRG